LADAFEQSFKSKSVEDAQAALARTSEIADQLRGKITQLGSLAGFFEGFEKLTGLKIFGVEDTKKAIEQAREQMVAQEEIIELRKKEKEQIDAIEDATRAQVNQRKVTAETLKFIDAIRKTKKTSVQQAELEVETALELRNENKRILEILEATNQGQRNLEAIQKRRIAGAQLELNIIKAQNSLRIVRQAESGSVLTGSRAGRQALEVAAKQKQRQDTKQAFRDELAAVKERQDKENQSRAKRGLPMLNQADIRKRMAAEAVGGQVQESAEGVGAMRDFSQNLLGDRAATMAATKAREEAAPSDFNKRVEEFKAREAQKVMQEEGAEKKKGGYQKTKIRGQEKGSSGGGDLSAAIKALADKIPAAVPQ
jgi:hypothetical protein